VTVGSTGARLVQRTPCPAERVTVSTVNLMAAMTTSAAIATPAGAPSATGLGEPWNHGLKRFKCSGIVNSKPYRIKLDPVPKVVSPRDAPCIVALPALLACREKVCGEPGMRRFRATRSEERRVGKERRT